MREWFMGRKGCEVGGGAPGGRNGGLSIEGVAAAAAAARLVSIAARAAARAAVRAAARARAVVPATAWALVPATAWALAALLCLAAPAQAFWGDYGPEPRPEIFGVRLGDDIRNYKGMKMRPGPHDSPHRRAYQRRTGEYLTFFGVPLGGAGSDFKPYYSTYKNKINSIIFSVRPEDYEAAARKISAMFGPPHVTFAWPGSTEFRYIWMNSEVFVDSDRDGSFDVSWLPIEKKLYGDYAVKWDKPVSFEGVLLGGKVDDYPFLKETCREGPEVIHYRSEEPLPGGIISCEISAFKGVIYGVTLLFHDYESHPRSYAMNLLGLPFDRDEFFHFFGDVQIDWFFSVHAYIQLTPIYWEANRARFIYYRNIKPD